MAGEVNKQREQPVRSHLVLCSQDDLNLQSQLDKTAHAGSTVISRVCASAEHEPGPHCPAPRCVAEGTRDPEQT